MLTRKIIIFTAITVILAGSVYGGYRWRKSQKIEDVTFVVMKGGSTEFLMNVIKSEGLDIKNRINIIPRVAPSPPEGERMFFAREGIDASPTGPITVAQQNLTGKNIKIIGPYLLNHISIVVKKESPYQSLSDLKGKKVATRTKTTALYQTLALAMQKVGLNPEDDFYLVFPPSIAESGLYLKRGDVEAAAIPEPEATKLLATGEYRELTTLRDLWKDLTGEQFGFVYTIVYQDWIDAHPKAAKRLVKTITDGASYISSHPEAVAKYQDLWGAKTEEEVRSFQERVPRLYTASWDDRDTAHINSVLQAAVDLGLLSEMPQESIIAELK